MSSEMQRRACMGKYETRSEGNEKIISGYFAVFGSVYELWRGATESIDPHAFDGQLSGDIRCLIDHDSRLVLGRTKSGTLTLKTDEYGLWGEVRINEKDTDAMNLYERVSRGDVDQCSFGFNITDEEYRENPDGTVHWTIKSVELFEVSCVTFPAYKETSITARKSELESIRQRKLDEYRHKVLAKLKGEQ